MKHIEENHSADGAQLSPGIDGDGKAGRISYAPLAAAAYLAGAIALVNPALADECGDALEAMRSAAGEGRVSGIHLIRIDAAIDKAVLRLDLGDATGCLAELKAIRATLPA